MQTFTNNKNLTIFNQTHFNGWEVVPGYPLCTEYLESIEAVLNRALSEHPRTLVVRFDLHLPYIVDCPDYPSEIDTSVVTRFFSSFESKVKWDFNKKIKMGGRPHPCTVRYIWAKEINKSLGHHYHVALLLNKDRYYGLGDYSSVGDNLAGKIFEAWASALKCTPHEIKSLVYFPDDSPCYRLDRNSQDYAFLCNEVFRRLSYLGKFYTKRYGDKTKNFSRSNR
ncbi:MAG: transposase [Colwellia sp.]|nr:MAG: transposase [Colwellia sp.]